MTSWSKYKVYFKWFTHKIDRFDPWNNLIDDDTIKKKYHWCMHPKPSRRSRRMRNDKMSWKTQKKIHVDYEFGNQGMDLYADGTLNGVDEFIASITTAFDEAYSKLKQANPDLTEKKDNAFPDE